ncbi:serine/threonine-protein phosphatase 7 long form homolog [Cryptomeria japonica]|uniref:serine/threonine-protein phosphatase 7 long form homolog n=1 Tax=Cryptomeria japonica TaxID=3369 RepID=UPI0027DA1E9C|nr:serine/threonine-protein phosphatase 7 long form homolog [Cryptomeria japonica]
MITTLVERWHSKTCSFHLPNAEALITLEDAWCILHIPIHGARVIYDYKVGIVSMCELRECTEEELQIRGQYEIPWEAMDYDDLTIVLCSVLAGLLISDRWTHGLSIGWSRVIHDMIVQECVFAWGPCLLATFYHQMHDIVYLRQRNIGGGVTLLQVWEWEHIVIARSTIYVELQDEKPYANRSSSIGGNDDDEGREDIDMPDLEDAPSVEGGGDGGQDGDGDVDDDVQVLRARIRSQEDTLARD